MDKKQLLTGMGKYFRGGSRGDRYKLIIDDVKLSEWIDKEIEDSVRKHKLKADVPIKNIGEFLRNKKIEVRLI